MKRVDGGRIVMVKLFVFKHSLGCLSLMMVVVVKGWEIAEFCSCFVALLVWGWWCETKRPTQWHCAAPGWHMRRINLLGSSGLSSKLKWRIYFLSAAPAKEININGQSFSTATVIVVCFMAKIP